MGHGLARVRVSVRATRNFERNLAQIGAFLAETDSPSGYDKLIDALAGTVVPNLERYPRIGRLFLERAAESIEGQERMAALKKMRDAGELREYVAGDYLILYALLADTIYLLAIKHHRQLSFDIAAHWLSS